MSYLVLARKYRPLVFDDIVGQEHVALTLKNAIKTNRVSHAYLFTGPRGVGKTTTARILAKILNCENPKNFNPCNACAPCLETTEGRSLDVLEIDGASNRGIDEIRDLREKVKYSPSRGNYKVYIIDEVHMLTTEAFNALLKTLEEPPGHVIFIFATTEPQKVLTTILSRCQRFDFRRIETTLIIERAKEVLQKENVSISDEALFSVARKAAGSLRDALSLLDQVISFCEGNVQLSDVKTVLGVVDDELYVEIIRIIGVKRKENVIRFVDKLMNSGKDLMEFYVGLIEHLRAILILKVLDDGSDVKRILEVSDATLENYKNLTGSISTDDLLKMIQALVKNEYSFKTATQQKILLEVMLLRLAMMDSGGVGDESTTTIEKVSERKVSNPANPTRKIEETKNYDTKPEMVRIDGEVGVKNEKSDRVPEKQVIESEEQIPLSLDSISGHWPGLVENIMSQKRTLGTVLQDSTPYKLDGNKLTIALSNGFGFHREFLSKYEHRTMVEKEISDLCSSQVIVRFEAKNRASASQGMTNGEHTSDAMAQESDDPLLKRIIGLFDAEIIDRTQEKRSRAF